MSEVKVNVEVGSNWFVIVEFLAVIGRQCVGALSKRRQQKNHRICNRQGCFVNDFAYRRLARLALLERHQCLLIVRTGD